MKDILHIILISIIGLTIISCKSSDDDASSDDSSLTTLATLTYQDLSDDFDPSTGKGAYLYLATGDLNNDQKEDAVFGHFFLGSEGDLNISSKLGFFVNSGGSFATNTDLFESIPVRVKPRYGLIADYNDDDKNDMFVACQGWDNIESAGEQNILMLSTTDNKLSDVSTTSLPVQNDNSHGAAHGDIDKDGDLDIFVINSYGGGTINSYFLINDGSGTFTMDNSTTRISQSLIAHYNVTSGTNAAYVFAHFYDVNQDGAVDLILSSHPPRGNATDFTGVFYSRIVLNDGSGHFLENNVIEFSEGIFGTETISYGAWPFDLNQDNKIDFVIAQTKDLPPHRGLYLQVHMNQGNNTFTDATAEWIPNQDFYADQDFSFPDRVFFKDFNGDGNNDIIVGSYGSVAISGDNKPSVIFVNDGTGKMTGIKGTSFYSGSDWLDTLVPSDFNGDGKLDLLGINPKEGGYNLVQIPLQSQKEDGIEWVGE